MDKIKQHWKWGLLFLYAVIILAAVSFLGSYTHTDSDELYLTPRLQDNMGWDIYTLENDGKTDITPQELLDSTGEIVYLSRTLEEDLEGRGYTVLELSGGLWQCSVFLDGDLLYTVAPGADNRIGSVTFPEEHRRIQGVGEYIKVSLPPNYGGKTLTVAFSADSHQNYKSMPMVRLSGESIKTQLTVAMANSTAMPAAVYIAAALLLLGLFVYGICYGKQTYPILLLAVASLIQALRTLMNFEFYFTSRFSMNAVIAELLIPLCVILPMLYLLMNMKRWRRWYAWFLGVPAGITVVFHLAARIKRFSFLSGYTYDALLYIPLLALVGFAVLEFRSRNEVYLLFTPVFFITVAGIAITCISMTLLPDRQSDMAAAFMHPLMMSYELLQLCGSILLILCGIVGFLLTVKKAADTRSELSVMSVKNELITENIQSIQKSRTKLAKMRHDMLRHLHTMQDLCHEGDMKRLEDYIQEITKDTEAIVPMQVCQHPVINALITRALVKAEKEKIKLGFRVDVPSELSVADTDLCTLLNNMLDNALEAVALLPAEAGRSIDLTMHIRGRYLLVETRNPCYEVPLTDARTGLFISRKGDGSGYGMKAMADVARKYHSMLQVKREANTVIVRTALLLPEEN